MKTLNGDEDFLCINQCINIFDIVKCKEEQASQIIAWLLNPREAHGLGDIFFAAFLDAIFPNSDKIYGYKYKRDEKDKITECYRQKETLKNAYKDVIIQTEYHINTNIKENRIDILLCLEQAKSLFVIENKYGAKEHNQQTQQYFKHFSKAKYKDYAIFYIYLDVYDYYGGGGYTLADSKHWKVIDYTWIINNLKQSRKNKNYAIAKLLHDIYIEFSGDYKCESYFTPYYEQERKILSQYKGNGISKYDITQNHGKYDIQHYNYRNFYDTINYVSFWEKYLEINDDYIYQFDKKKFKCDIGRTRMYLTPIAIYKKYHAFMATCTEKLDWPIYCTLEYKDNQINYKLEYPKKNLRYFDNSDLLNNLDEKREKIPNNAKGSCKLKDLPKQLNEFLSNCSESFEIIQKEKYIK